MALSASTVLEVRQTGSDTNGGGWVTGTSGTDWSQQTSAQYATTDGVTVGTTTITSATAAFGTDVVGNLIYVAGGTGSITGAWYQIVTRTNSTTIVVDRSTGLTTGTGATLNIGGALGTPGQAAAILSVSGQRAWVKYSATAYTLSTATPGAGGPVVMPGNVACSIEGYDATRGDRTGNQPVISWGSVTSPGSLTYLCSGSTGNADNQRIANITANGNSVNNVGGFSAGNNRASISQCVAENCNGTGGVGFGSVTNIYSCLATSCTTGFSGSNLAQGCVATLCTTGFLNILVACKCLANLCTGSGFSMASGGQIYVNCTADSNSVSGFVASGGTGTFLNCLASNHTGGSSFGFNATTAANTISLQNCAVYNNSTNVTTTDVPLLNEGLITLTAQPYVTAGSDFRPNSTSSGGAALRAAGIGVYGQTDDVDVGAVQSTPATGTAGMLVHPGMSGGARG